MIAAPQERFAQGRRKGPQTVAPRRGLAGSAVADRAAAFSGVVPEVAEGDGGYRRGRKRTGLRLTFHGGLPETLVGRVLAGVTALGLLAAMGFGGSAVRRLMQRDQRFLIPGTGAIETVGNQHLTRDELLGVLGDDVGRNVFSLSLEKQRAALERLPWVEHATVMRLLPERLRATVTERTPIAFAREKGKIGLVDAQGVLLDLRQPAGGGSYSFPVVTGVGEADPVNVRAARMRQFSDFVGALDGTGEHISAKLSEIDLSNPEDVRALIPDNGSEILVHFGDVNFLNRYRMYEAHLPEWRQQYPHLASVDMRYERQAVLEMAPGTAVPVNGTAGETNAEARAPAAAHGAGHTAAVLAPAPMKTHGASAGHGPAGRGLAGRGPATIGGVPVAHVAAKAATR